MCGLVLRILFGEPSLNIPAVLPVSNLPVRTIAATITFIVIVLVSNAAKYVFSAGLIKPEHDICRCFHKGNTRDSVVLTAVKRKDAGGTEFTRTTKDSCGEYMNNVFVSSFTELPVIEEDEMSQHCNGN